MFKRWIRDKWRCQAVRQCVLHGVWEAVSWEPTSKGAWTWWSRTKFVSWESWRKKAWSRTKAAESSTQQRRKDGQLLPARCSCSWRFCAGRFIPMATHVHDTPCTWYSIWLKSDRSAPMFFAVATLPQIAWYSRICRISKPSSFRAWIAVFRRQCAVYFVFYSYTRFVYFSSNKKQFKLIHIACIDFVESPILKIA